MTPLLYFLAALLIIAARMAFIAAMLYFVWLVATIVKAARQGETYPWDGPDLLRVWAAITVVITWLVS